jgi:hypothetical protein
MKNCNLLIPRTSKLWQKLSALKREHKKTRNFVTVSISVGLFPLLDQDPDPADQNQCVIHANPDPKHCI